MQLRVLATALGLAVLAAAPVHAQLENPMVSTPTTLNFHIFDTFNAFPINTQPMDAEFFEVGGTSFPTFADTPLGDYDFNTIYGFSTSGPVEYDFIENGRPRFHPERGIAADVEIDSSVEPMAYLYFEVRDLFSSEEAAELQDLGWEGLPNALPSFTVRVTMREGNEVGPDANLDAGPLIMSGELTAHLVDTQTAGLNDAFAGQSGPDGQPVFVPDESGIIEFAIPLDLAQATIPKLDAFNVRIDWFQAREAAGDDAFSEGYVRLVSDPEHQPRLELAILNPVYVEFLHPQVAAGRLLIHSGVNSPWGTYDVDIANITLTIEGPSQPSAPPQQVATQNAHVHGLHDRAAEVTWLWPFREDEAANGDYTLRIEVPNMAHTAVATATAGFTAEGKQAYGISDEGEIVEGVEDGGGNESPAGGVLALLAALGFAALRRRGPA